MQGYLDDATSNGVVEAERWRWQYQFTAISSFWGSWNWTVDFLQLVAYPNITTCDFAIGIWRQEKGEK